MSERIGPETRKIPAEEYKSCRGCIFYETTLIKSGLNPLYAHNCNNLGLKTLDAFFDYKATFGRGNLKQEDKTPDWCPAEKGDTEGL